MSKFFWPRFGLVLPSCDNPQLRNAVQRYYIAATACLDRVIGALYQGYIIVFFVRAFSILKAMNMVIFWNQQITCIECSENRFQGDQLYCYQAALIRPFRWGGQVISIDVHRGVTKDLSL